MKKIFLIFLLILTVFLPQFLSVNAQEKLTINFFYSVTCPHCQREQIFLDKIEKKYPDILVDRYEASKNTTLLKQFHQRYQVPLIYQGLVPLTFINDKYFVGFNDDLGKQMESYIAEVIGEKPSTQPKNENNKLTLPFIGVIDTDQYTLPALAIILGTLDGFNVCSLGALLIILTLVLSLRSRKKIIIFGSSYILTTGLIYGLLIYFWYQLFTLFTPYIRKMEIVIGLITLVGGVYFFKEFLKAYKYGPNCEIDQGKKLTGKFSVKFKRLIEKNKTILPIVLSVLIFAVTITVVEFPCSAAVPLTFAGILSKAQLPTLIYVLYISIFLIFYLLDELIVFLVAVFTMKLWLSSPKFVTWIILAQAIIMLFLSFHYLFGLF